jgi:hypothetical protein
MKLYPQDLLIKRGKTKMIEDKKLRLTETVSGSG